MPRFRSLSTTAAILALSSALFAAGLEEADDYASAQQALADGLPSVAGLKAERLLQQKGWTRVETRQLATFAAEAWSRAGDGARVLALADNFDLDDEPFWRGEALALGGDLNAARAILTEAHATAQHPRSQLLLAQVLVALEENAEARQAASALLDSADTELRSRARLLLSEIEINEGGQPSGLSKSGEDNATRFLRARALLQSGQTVAAEKLLQSVLSSTSGGEHLHQAATLLQAEALLKERRAPEAQEHLLKFLDSTAESSLWPEAFDLLNRVHQAIPPPVPLPEAVLRWISSGNAAQQQPDPPPALAADTVEFRGHAIYLTARWLAAQKRDDEALGMLEALLQWAPGHPCNRESMHLAMELYATRHTNERVLELAGAWHSQFDSSTVQIDFTVGGILFHKGEPRRALELFQNAANVAATLTERRRALFNAAVSALSASDLPLYQSLLGQLEVVSGGSAGEKDESDSAATLEVEKALYLAAQHKPEAEQALRGFIRTHPRHARHADACIALAEWLLLAVPHRIDEAEKVLDSASSPEITPAQRERVSYTRLWARDAAGELKTLVTDGAAFIKAWPKSPLLPEVRMKIAGAYYRLEDYANARTEFEIIAKEYPDTATADSALYFAAMSANSVMSPEGRARAVEIWDDLAQKNGPLAVAARRQQALSERLQGNHLAALTALDKVLAMKALDDEMRLTTLCEKAELLLLLGKSEPARLDAAADLLDEFLKDRSLPFMWKARAGFTLATVHHDARRDTEALEACYTVLQAAERTPPASPADYLWFSKAGFFGVDLLEGSRQWEAAARLAEQVSQRPGDRAAEARERATKIRLEHFLWEGPAPTPPKVLKFDPAEADKPAAPAPDKPSSKSSKKKARKE